MQQRSCGREGEPEGGRSRVERRKFVDALPDAQELGPVIRGHRRVSRGAAAANKVCVHREERLC